MLTLFQRAYLAGGSNAIDNQNGNKPTEKTTKDPIEKTTKVSIEKTTKDLIEKITKNPIEKISKCSYFFCEWYIHLLFLIAKEHFSRYLKLLNM